MNLKVKRISTFLLVLCLLFSVTTFPVTKAYDEEESLEKSDENITLDFKNIKYLTEKEIDSYDFIGRIQGKEELNSYVFLNRDGTESVCIFAENIKYVDETGKVREKDTTLVKDSQGGFVVSANDCGINFPNNIKDGYTFSYKGFDIKITPQNADAEAIKEDNSVYYNIDENTTLKYTPTLSGVKEDIILEKYTGKSSFDFSICANGLLLTVKDGILSLSDEEGNKIADFQEIYAYDSNGNVALGEIKIEDSLLTVTVPESFLKDEKTIYPVTIDPTITESSDGTYIQDAPVFANDQSSNYGSCTSNIVGVISDAYGEARTAMKLYGLSKNNIYKTLDAKEIESVKIVVDGSTNASLPLFVNCYRISSSVSWNESTVTWNNVGSYDTSYNAGTNLNSGEEFFFDITKFVKGWKNYSYTRSMSVIFTTDSLTNGTFRQFYSSDYSTASSRPYILLTYQYKNLMNDGVYFIKNKQLDKFVQPVGGATSGNNANIELRDFSGNSEQKWVVTSLGNGYYKIANQSTGYVLAVPDNSLTQNLRLTQSGYTGATGQKWRIYMTTYCGFAIKPKSANNSSDGSDWTNLVMSINDGNDGNGAQVAQRGYAYNDSFKDEWYLVPTTIQNGDEHYIDNRQLGKNARPVNGVSTTNAGIELWAASVEANQKWIFTRLPNGYYKISPKNYTSYALSVASGSETSENGTIRLETYSSSNTRQQWLIYRVPNGYVFKAKSSGTGNLVLSVSEGNLGNGAVVSQRSYVNNLSYKEEWKLTIGSKIPRGIYYIKQGNQYLTANGANIQNNTNVKISNLVSAGADITQKAAQMWEISDIGNGYYSIRPLHRLKMSLNRTSSNADIIVATTNPDTTKCTIHLGNSGYLIRNMGAEAGTLIANGTTSGSNVIFGNGDGTESKYWSIVNVAESNIPKGIAFYDSISGQPANNIRKYIAPEQTVSLEDLNLVPNVINPNGASQEVSLVVPSADSSYLRVNSSTQLTGLRYKQMPISVAVYADISGTMFTRTIEINVTSISNGEYFLNNRQKDQYAHVNGSLTANEDAIRHSFTGDNNERWKILLNNQTGYYTIKSLASGSTPYYLQVLNNASTLDQIVVVNTYSGTLPTGMQWRFELTANNSYKILPKSGEINGYVLATGSSNEALRQSAYLDNNSYLDEWYLLSVGSSTETSDNCDAFFLTIKHTGASPFDTFEHMGSCMRSLQQSGYSNFRFVKTEYFGRESDCISQIRKSRISVIGSHGGINSTYGSTRQLLENADHFPSGIYVTAAQIDSSSFQSYSNDYFSDVELIIYLGCETAAGTSNLCSASVNKGAQYAIGFADVISSPYCNDWLKVFFEKYYLNGESIQDACDIALSSIPREGLFSSKRYGLESFIVYNN